MKIKILIAIMALASCTNAPNIIFTEGTITRPTLSSARGATSITFSSAKAWVASVSEADRTWCSLSIAKGEAGEFVYLTVTTSENETYHDRVATVTITSEEVKKEVKITQNPPQNITLKNIKFKEFLLNAENITIGKIKLANEVTKVDVNGDGEINDEEALNVTHISCYSQEITSFSDIKHFTNLIYLSCKRNPLATLDLSGLTKLTYLHCSENQLTALNISGLTSLMYLSCSGNQLTTLDLSGLTNLENLYCSANKLTTLDLSIIKALESFHCFHQTSDGTTIQELTLTITEEQNNNQDHWKLNDSTIICFDFW